MALTSIELWQRIAAQQLATPQQCRNWAGDVARQLPATETVDGVKVLRCLIKQGKLTRYQAEVLAGKSQQPLQRGSWIVRRPLDGPLWNGWLEVVETSQTASRPVWSRWLDAEQLLALRSAAPSLARALQLSGLNYPSLQATPMPIKTGGELQVLIQPVVGQALTEQIQAPWPAAATSRWIQALAGALAELHDRQLVHGRVLPDRIFAAGTEVTLVCDPLCLATATPDRSATGLLGSQLRDMQVEHFLAPEFLAPGQTPTQASDIYALGCTWFWLLTGRTPASGASPSQILASHVNATVELPATIDYPPALARCLAHCLAKNLSARFPSARSLALALDRAMAATATMSSSAPTPATSKPVAMALAELVDPEAGQPLKTKTSSKANAQPTGRVEPIAAAVAAAAAAAAAAAPQPPAVTPAASAAPQPVPATSKQTTAKQTPSIQPTAIEPMAIQTAAIQTAAIQPTAIPTAAIQTSAIQTSAIQTSAQPMPGQSLGPAVEPAAAVATPVAGRRIRRQPRWLIFSAGLGGFVLLMLLLLKLSGALDTQPPGEDNRRASAADYRAATGGGSDRANASDAAGPTRADPRAAVYQLSDEANQLWAPPRLPTPTPLDLLPPGGEWFLTCRPQKLLGQPEPRKLLATMNNELNPSLVWLQKLSGAELESIALATVAGYNAARGDGVPDYAVRIRLAEPQTLGTLRQRWQIVETATVEGQQLMLNGAGTAYYVAAQPLVDGQSVLSFSCGPASLMEEVARLKGAAGPLVTAMEKLWRESDAAADLNLQASPRFLFAGGRSLIEGGPERLRDALRQTLDQNARAVLFKSFLEPEWYWEFQLIGQTDRDAPLTIDQWQTSLAAVPDAIEGWFVESPPHPYWRAVALRYPQMLRRLNDFSRFGVENGVAIMNGYLPTEAANNLVAATWIALQPGATAGETLAAARAPVSAPPLTIEQYLQRPIRLNFDQEPIEAALRLISEEANAGLPSGSPPLRFVLDGDAFEKAGITRNQQLRNYKIENQPVRVALTEVTKRGNPVTTVTDTREVDQKLIWVVAPDPETPGTSMLSLTTREAATAAGIALPKEFAPPD